MENYQYICYMKKILIKKVLQVIANNIISILANTRNEDMFNFYFEMGAMINAYAIIYHDIELD